MASCETDAGAADATLSWPASASCCPALTAAFGGCTRPHSAQGLLHVLAAVEPVGLQDIRYATIEPLDHAVGSRRPGLGQPMLYAQRLAQLVELMVATGLAFAVGKQSVGELLAVVGQQLVDPDRASLVQCLQEGLCTGSRLVGLELHEHPSRGPVDGDEQVAPAALVAHLGQVFHIHVHVARLVALEGLVGHRRLLGLDACPYTQRPPAS